MANATLSTTSGTKTGNFSVTVTFGTAVTGFAKTDITLTRRTENGTTGVDFSMMGAGTTWTLSFTLPSNVEGSFTIDITGKVTVSGTEASVTASPLTIVYDTTANVTATFGTVAYQENGVIEVPITFAEKVIAPAASIFALARLSGDSVEGMAYRLIGKDTAFTLSVAVPPNRKGSFSVAIDGEVFKVATQIWDNVVITPKTVTYDTRVPIIQNYDIPSSYRGGQRFDVVMEFNVPVTFNDPTAVFHSKDATYLDFFLFEGADLGTPNLFRSVSAMFPTLPLPADLQADTNWTQADLQTVAANIFVLRWDTVQRGAQGSFNVTLRPGSVRGPVN